MNKILSLLLLASTVALSHASYSCETYCGYSAVKNASVAPAGSVNRTSYFFDDGQFPPSVYDAQDGVCGLQVYVNDKTITITGVVYAYNDPSTGFFMNIQGNINNAQTGGHLELSSSSYKANGGPIDPSTWYFYSLSSGALTGFGAYQGVFIALQESMAPLQVGVGANGKNYNLGLSAWFAYNISGKIYSSDINIDLVCKEQTCFPAWNITGALDYAVTFRSTSGVLTKYNFIDPTGILVEDATLSSAVVGGQIRNVDGTGETCTFALLLVRDKSYNMPHEELPSSAYKANGGPIDPSTWRYYALVSGSVTCPSYYISLATYEGMDLQIGVGANDKNYNFGASGWFEYNNATGNVSGVMDINVDLICGPLAPTPAPPTPAPTPVPTSVPTATPTSVPTSVPTAAPTVAPTAVPTSVPTSAPTPVATSVPTAAPTVVPTPTPTLAPCSVTVTATYIPGTAGFIVVNGQNVINANYELSVVSHASETVTSVDITFAPYSGSYVTNASSNLVPTSTGITNEYILNTQLTSGNTDSSATISTIFAATGYAPNIPIASAVAQCGAVTSAPTPAPTSASATGASGTTTGSETTGSSGSSASTTGSSATGSSTTSGSYTCPPNPYVAEQAIADQYGGYSYFSVIFNDTGINQQWRFNFENNAGTFIINENDGTAALYGILVPESSNPNDGLFDFQISLYIGFNPGSVPAIPFEELNPDAYVPNGPVDPATWKYFTYANSSSTPIGATGYALNIVPFMDMQFQVGAGANGKNINFGAASWFSFYLVNSANTLVSSGKADVNVDLVCQPSSSSEATGTTGATDSSATSSVGTTQVGAQQTSPPAPTAAATTAGAATVTYSMMLAFFVTIVLNFV